MLIKLIAVRLGHLQRKAFIDTVLPVLPIQLITMFSSLLILILLVSKGCWSIDEFNSAASEFIFAMFPNYYYDSGQKNLHISTQESTSVTVTVRINGGSVLHTTTTVMPNTGKKIVLPYDTQVDDVTQRNYGINVTAQNGKSIRVAVENYAQYTSDSYLILPTLEYPVMNYTYYAVSTGGPGSIKSMAIIVATKDNTMVTITPTQPITVPSDLVPGGTTVSSGNSVSFTLNSLKTFAVIANNYQDITGTKVFTNKPIALFTGHECGNVPTGVCCCDVLMEQVTPTVNWGKSFIFATLRGQAAGTYVKVLGHESGTTFNIRCSNGFNNYYSLTGSPKVVTERLQYDNLICSLTANKPIFVVLLCPSQQHGSTQGDPFMMIVPPTEQFSTNVTFPGYGDRFTQNYVNIAVLGTQVPSGVYLGTTLITSGWTAARYPTNNSIIGYVTQVTTSGIQYNMKITENRKMAVYVYGYNNYDSYGYVAGMDLLPTAEVPDCGPPEVPSGSQLLVAYSTTFYTSVANYTCVTGYTLIGNGTRVCLQNSTWSGAVPVCQIINCGHLSVVPGSPGGLVVSYTTTEYNSVATYSCTQEGYNMIGFSLRVCSSTGTWSGSAPYCLIVNCGTPDISTNGDVSAMLAYSSTVFNSTVEYTCDIGYDIHGNTSRVCLASGQWSGLAPECFIVTCGSLFVPSGAPGGLTVTYSDTVYNSSATYSCTHIGYELTGSFERVCEDNGNWSNVEPTCQLITCGIPDVALGNESILTTAFASTTYSSIVSYTCAVGYNLIGPLQRICQSNKQWSAYSPYCQIVDCGPLSVPMDSLGGLFVVFPDTIFNSTATYSCPLTGFVLIGMSERKCAMNGSWTNTVPHCEIVPLNFTALAQDAKTISVDWVIPPSATNVVTHYIIEITSLVTLQVNTYFSIETQALVPGLHPQYSYSCRVAAFTTYRHPFTSSIHVQMPQAAPTGSPLSPNLLVLSSRSLNVTWSPPLPVHQNGLITNYLINALEEDTATAVQYSTSANWLLLTQLHPHYRYTFTFAAVTVEVGPFGSSISVRMPEDAPTASPSNISLGMVESTSISISWLPPPLEHQNGIVRKFILAVTEIETSNKFNLTVASYNTSTTIYSLHPYYTYQIYVFAFTVATSPPSQLTTVQTEQDIPSGPVANITGFADSPYSVTLMWTPPPIDQHNGVLTGYVINVAILENNGSFSQISQNSSLILGQDTLKPFRTYTFAIAAMTVVGVGPTGDLITIKTPPTAPTGAPSVTSTSFNSRHIAISWNQPDYEEQNGNITHYVINITELQTGVSTVHTTTGHSISVPNLHPAYTYQCTIAAFTVALGPFTLPISITTAEEAPSSSPVSLIGSAISPTEVAFTWVPPPPEDQNGVIVMYIVNITMLGDSQSQQFTTSNTSIVINNLQPYRHYSCIVAAATNAGTGPYSIIFKILTPQAAPSSSPMVTVTSVINSRTVLMQWTPPPAEDHNGVIIKYIVNVTSKNTGAYRQLNITGTSAVIVDLVASFTYYLSVSAYTVDTGPYSQYATITLPQDVPTGFPRNVQGISPSPTSIDLTWSPPPLEEQSGDILQYIVNITHAGTLETYQYLASTTNITVTSLQPYTTYFCIIAAKTAIGSGPFSHFFFIQTQESVPSSSPEHLGGVPVSPTSIHLTWDPPPLEHHNGEIDGYRVNVSEIATGQFTQHFSNQTQITIGNLRPFHAYHCQVTAVTVGEGPYTDVVVVVTDEAAPSTSPSLVSVTVLGPTSITMSWSLPTIAVNGIIREYSIIVEDTRTGELESYIALGTSINITNLHPYTNYSCRVAAITVATGPFSPSANITTDQDAPSSPPEQFTATALSSSAILLQWNPPSIDSINGIIQQYVVTVLEQETGNITQITTMNTSFNMTNLHPYYTYECSVLAVTVASGPLTMVTIQMPEDAPSSAPTGVVVVTVSSTVIEILWNSLPFESRNGIVRYYTIRVNELQTGLTIQTNSTTESLSLGNLHPAYTYVASVAAVTIERGPFSSTVTTNTDEDVPSSPPTNLAVSVENSTAAHIFWNPPPHTDHNGVITVYTVTIVNKRTDVVFEYTTLDSTFIVTTLSPFTNYEFAVAANTTVGMGPQSTFVQFITDEDAPSTAPSDFSVEAPTSTSLQLSWSPPTVDNQNGIIRSYIVNVTRVDAVGDVMVYTTTVTSLTVGAVVPFTSYKCAVAAVTISQGPFSNSVIVQTPQDAPSSAPVVNVTAANSTTVLISWEPTPTHKANGIITGYTINVSITETQTQTQYIVSATELILTDLHPYYTYTIIVSASTIKPGPFSMEYSVTTPPAAPSGPPQNITADVINATRVQWTWQLPLSEYQNGIVQSYSIMVFELETNSTKVMHQTYLHSSIVISSLHPYYHYKFSVAAYTVALGPYSDITVLTDQHAPTSPPLNVSITIASSTSVTLQWSPPPAEHQNGIIQHYTLQLNEHVTGDTSQYTTASLHYTFNSLHPHYTYTCTIAAATVGLGPAQPVVFQMPQDAPSDSPYNVQGVALNATTLLLLWQSPQQHQHNGIITAYNILLREVQTDSTALHVLTGNGTSIVISALHPSYQYEVQVAAVTVLIGPYSNTTVVIQLPESAPSGHPLQVAGSSMSPTTILLTWSPPSMSDHNGVLTGYVIQTTEIDTQLTIQHTTSVTNNFTISSLNPFSNYLCTVAAKTSVGLGPFSPGEVIQTQQSAPSGSPQHVGGVTVSSTSIHLTWDPPNLMQQNGIVKFYVINLTEVESGMQARHSINQTQITIENLHPFYTYNLTVAAVTVSEGPHTEVVSIMTDQQAPSGPPVNLSFTATNSTSVTLQWSPPLPEQQNGIVQQYTLQLSGHETGDTIQHTTSSDMEYTFNGLHPHYTYTCSIAAITVGLGPAQPIVFQMPQDAPSGPPRNLSATSVNATALLLRWLPPSLEEQNGIIVEYEITLTELSTNTSIDIVSTSNTTETVINDLHPYYRYSIQVAAATILSGPLGDSVTIQMPESEPGSAPRNFFFEMVMHLSASFVWTQPLARDHNGIITGYQLSCISDRGHNLTAQVEGTTFTITNLRNHSHYTCSVCAYTSPGCGPAAVTYISTYDESPVGPPQVSVLNTSATWINIMWSPPFDPENVTLGFGLTYQLINSSLLTSTPRPQTAITNIARHLTLLTLQPLLKASQYRIVMYTITAQGTSPASNKLLVSTKQYDANGPRNFTCESTSPDALMCTWIRPELNGSNLVEYQLSYGLVEKFDYYPGYGDAFEQVTLPAIKEQHNITSLPPYGGYLLELKAFVTEDSTGGDPGNLALGHIQEHGVSTVAFTAEQVPGASVRNFSVTVSSPRSLLLTWLPPERIYWHGVTLHYEISVVQLGPVRTGKEERSADMLRLQVEPKTNLKDPSLVTEPLQSESHVVENLEEYYQYSISVVMVNSAGEGQPTQPVVQNMPQAKPSGPPIEINATNITSYSIAISWLPPSALDANGVISGYTMIITTSGVRGMTRTIELTRTLYTESDLEPYQEVLVTVAAKTKVGTGPFSKRYAFHTAESPPRAPQSLTVTIARNAERTVILSWRPPDTPNGIIIEYMILYAGYSTPNKTTDALVSGHKQTTPTSQTIRIDNLRPGLHYIFKVRALNGAGYGANATSTFVAIDQVTITDEPVAGSAGGINILTISVPLVVVIVLMICVFVVIVVCFIAYQRRTKKRTLYDPRSRGTELNDRTIVAVNPLAFCEVSENMEIPLNKLELQTPPLSTTEENVYEKSPIEQSPEQHKKLQAKDIPLPPTPSNSRFQRPTVVIQNDYEVPVFSQDITENDEYIYETMDGTEAKLVVKEDKKAEDGKLDSTKVQDVNESDDKETMYSEERVDISFL